MTKRQFDPDIRPRKVHLRHDNAGKQQPNGRPYANTLCMANGNPLGYLTTDLHSQVTCKSCKKKMPLPVWDQPELVTETFHLSIGKGISHSTIPMILFCPSGHRHIDEHEFAEKPHHTHACQTCGIVWRPALVNTHGVQFLPGFKNP